MLFFIMLFFFTTSHIFTSNDDDDSSTSNNQLNVRGRLSAREQKAHEELMRHLAEESNDIEALTRAGNEFLSVIHKIFTTADSQAQPMAASQALQSQGQTQITLKSSIDKFYNSTSPKLNQIDYMHLLPYFTKTTLYDIVNESYEEFKNLKEEDFKNLLWDRFSEKAQNAQYAEVYGADNKYQELSKILAEGSESVAEKSSEAPKKTVDTSQTFKETRQEEQERLRQLSQMHDQAQEEKKQRKAQAAENRIAREREQAEVQEQKELQIAEQAKKTAAANQNKGNTTQQLCRERDNYLENLRKKLIHLSNLEDALKSLSLSSDMSSTLTQLKSEIEALRNQLDKTKPANLKKELERVKTSPLAIDERIQEIEKYLKSQKNLSNNDDDDDDDDVVSDTAETIAGEIENSFKLQTTNLIDIPNKNSDYSAQAAFAGPIKLLSQTPANPSSDSRPQKRVKNPYSWNNPMGKKNLPVSNLGATFYPDKFMTKKEANSN